MRCFARCEVAIVQSHGGQEQQAVPAVFYLHPNGLDILAVEVYTKEGFSFFRTWNSGGDAQHTLGLYVQSVIRRHHLFAPEQGFLLAMRGAAAQQ